MAKMSDEEVLRIYKDLKLNHVPGGLSKNFEDDAIRQLGPTDTDVDYRFSKGIDDLLIQTPKSSMFGKIGLFAAAAAMQEPTAAALAYTLFPSRFPSRRSGGSLKSRKPARKTFRHKRMIVKGKYKKTRKNYKLNY
jgi:hypothetical protein